MKTNRFLIVAALAVFCACSGVSIEPNISPEERVEEPENPDDDGDDDSKGTGDNTITIGEDNDEDRYESASFDKLIEIEWNGDAATLKTGSPVLPVSIVGADVVVGEPASEVSGVNLILSGSSSNGSLKVYNMKKTSFTLKGLQLVSKTGPAFNLQASKRNFIVLGSGTVNSLEDASAYTSIPDGEDAKACLFSEGKIIFLGDGSITVKGNCKHAIASDDYVRMFGGNVTVSGAASDGIHVNDYIRVDAGVLDITCDGDAMDSEDYINVVGGTVKIRTSKSKAHGLKAVGDILVSGGEIDINLSGTASKCIKSDNNISIKGGSLTLVASGGGAYDSALQDNSTAACIKAENIVEVAGAKISCTAKGNGGKGINSYDFVCGEGAEISITTSGASYSGGSGRNADVSYAKALKASHDIVINDGKIEISTSGSGAEGIEGKGSVTINGGEVYIVAKDDAINSGGQIQFNGGYIYAQSNGNDGIDSNYGRANSIVVDGAVVITHSQQSPECGFDADGNSFLTFKSGVVFCTGGQQGGAGSGPVCSQSTMYIGCSVSKGWFAVTDASGNVVEAFYIPMAISQNYSFLSSADLKSGSTYYYGNVGSVPSGSAVLWHDVYAKGGTATKPSASFTANGGYQSVGNTSGGGGGGGGGWRPGGGW